ncbi:helix-turn-helix transcriptional regulator [Brevibacterium sp. FME37]|uniref:helix-turn-helix transcriptional regulator n=1 Tax=Brevibacterium sp. FME37 TaxID=2742607 RepID=UPI0018677962|nr:helix-turn-helix domain-containing protein [Brevibacterium sp. FME37]
MRTIEPDDDFISEAEAAQILRVSPRTQRLHRATGIGPDYIKSGRTVLYRRSTVLNWLVSLERPAGTA